jgi:drug/metabolite transporter (DMT)-like permease
MSKRERRFQLWGWILFIVCAGFFIASAIHNHDALYLIGSIVFLVACIVFVIPLVTGKKCSKPSREESEPEE